MKNIFIKIATVLLLAAMTVSCFAGCNNEPVVETPESTPEETPAQTPEETPAETEPPVVIEDLKLVENGATAYKVIRSQSCEGYEMAATSAFVKTFKEKTGATIAASDDWINEALGYVDGEFEVLIGRTERPESLEVYSKLRIDDYAVSIVNKKVVIAAFNEEKLNEAVNYFFEKLSMAEAEAKFLADDSAIIKGEYAIDDLTLDGVPVSAFRIIHKNGPTETIKNAAARLAEKLLEYGYNIEVKSDVVDPIDHEIVICDTNRGRSAEETKSLLALDYKMYMEDGKLYVLAGSNAKSVDAALDDLIGKLVGSLKDGVISLSKNDLSVNFESGAYKTRQLILNGIDVSEYTVVYAQGDTLSLKLADRVCDVIEQVCGKRLNLVSDTRAYKGENEIIIGYSSKRLDKEASEIAPSVNALGDNQYLLFKKGNFLYVGGKKNDNAAITAAVNRLIDELLAVSDPAKSEMTLDISKGSAIGGGKYSIMTFNDGDNRYQNINDRMAIVKEYMPDIVGFQETQTAHATAYKSKLGAYDYVLYDNDGTTFNSQPIFWKKDMFELVDSGIQWLTNTPDRRSKIEESDYIRSYTFAILKDKTTGQQIVVINTHIDYTAAANKVQMEKLAELTARFRDLPMIFLGDFNMRDNSVGYSTMYNECFIDSGRYLKASKLAAIDFIFVDITRIVPVSYKMIDDHEMSGQASDHNAVYTEFLVGLK